MQTPHPNSSTRESDTGCELQPEQHGETVDNIRPFCRTRCCNTLDSPSLGLTLTRELVEAGEVERVEKPRKSGATKAEQGAMCF